MIYTQKLSNKETFILESAIYKGKNNELDVTDIVNNLLIKYKTFKVSNNLFGDIEPNTKKYLIINEVYIFYEDSMVYLDKPSRDLGIFYTNNNIDEKIIENSLQIIYKNKPIKLDIITSTWKNIPTNPFIELKSNYQIMSHLNICLQILQCLVFAKNINNYEYVYFLEHDVLYPMNYFNLLERESNVYCNINYIGLNKEGFQKQIRVDKPLSQMVMKFDFALNHFHNLILNYISEVDYVNIEPLFKDIKLIESQYPTVHINHNKPFTSHFDCYGDIFSTTHDYWGDSSNYF